MNFARRSTIAALAISACVIASLAFGQAARPLAEKKELLIDFESLGADVDNAPSGFTAEMTGGGDPEGWRIEEGAPPINGTGGKKQLARRSNDGSENRSPVCVYDDLSARDVDVTVQFKALSGNFEQSAGVMVRYQDKDNYYVLRANAKVGNVALFKVTDGKLEMFADRSTAVTLKKWQKLRLLAKGDAFEAFLDDVSLFTAKDGAINDAGKVGLWTRSDSEALFDDLKIVVND